MNEVKLEQFVGIFPNAISVKTCVELVKWFDIVSSRGLTMASSEERMNFTSLQRNDELVHLPVHFHGLESNCVPNNLGDKIWQNLQDCYLVYSERYATPVLMSNSYKIHRVQPSGGYHEWHIEHAYSNPYRVLAWMVILESPQSGGETEFLHQSLRVEPVVGQLTIWPAGFTHRHRGNPPLEGQKTYMTGWFDIREQ